MTTTSKTTCDSCGAEIGETKYASEYYLQLKNVGKQNNSGMSYACALQPFIPHDMDFCNIQCLKGKFYG
jgi:hypothetical protein